MLYLEQHTRSKFLRLCVGKLNGPLFSKNDNVPSVVQPKHIFKDRFKHITCAVCMNAETSTNLLKTYSGVFSIIKNLELNNIYMKVNTCIDETCCIFACVI